ncbi:MAG: hypothetical protein JST47_10555 [Bacteroidetes bacterium]|nr:hypothetical protein [Bacteroidota bacterium]
MKSTTKNSFLVLKTIAVAATTTVLIAGNPVSVFANNNPAKSEIVNNSPEAILNVQYVGADERMYAFKVEFENPTAGQFTLIVKNDEGDVVYSKEFSDAHFEKTIKLMKEGPDMENIRPTIAIIAGNKLFQRSFAVETNVVKRISVTKP